MHAACQPGYMPMPMPMRDATHIPSLSGPCTMAGFNLCHAWAQPRCHCMIHMQPVLQDLGCKVLVSRQKSSADDVSRTLSMRAV